MEKAALLTIVDYEILSNLESILNGKFFPKQDFKLDHNFRVIPYSSLGNENGILLGFKPDCIKIYIDDECVEKEAVIGIYEKRICSNTNEYNAIVGL